MHHNAPEKEPDDGYPELTIGAALAAMDNRGIGRSGNWCMRRCTFRELPKEIKFQDNKGEGDEDAEMDGRDITYKVNPTNLRFSGGQVTISAKVKDPSGVKKVWAEVQKPSGEKVEVEMIGSSVYQGTFEANPNTRNDGQAETYKVRVRAMDGKKRDTFAGFAR